MATGETGARETKKWEIFPFEVGSRCYRVVQHESHKSLSVVLDEKSELKSVLETEVLEKVMETYQRVQKKFLGGNMVWYVCPLEKGLLSVDSVKVTEWARSALWSSEKRGGGGLIAILVFD